MPVKTGYRCEVVDLTMARAEIIDLWSQRTRGHECLATESSIQLSPSVTRDLWVAEVMCCPVS